jgi:hypothetical protein
MQAYCGGLRALARELRPLAATGGLPKMIMDIRTKSALSDVHMTACLALQQV